MKATLASKKWAERVFEQRPITVTFTRVPSSCARAGCWGYHDGIELTVTEDGQVYWQLVMGYHAIVSNPYPRRVGQGVEALARAGRQLLAWARRVEPWACYPEVGYRPGAEGKAEEVWF